MAFTMKTMLNVTFGSYFEDGREVLKIRQSFDVVRDVEVNHFGKGPGLSFPCLSGQSMDCRVLGNSRPGDSLIIVGNCRCGQSWRPSLQAVWQKQLVAVMSHLNGVRLLLPSNYFLARQAEPFFFVCTMVLHWNSVEISPPSDKEKIQAVLKKAVEHRKHSQPHAGEQLLIDVLMEQHHFEAVLLADMMTVLAEGFVTTGLCECTYS